MSYKVRYDNNRPGETPGPLSSGHDETLDAAKAHAERLQRREGFHNFSIWRGSGLAEDELVSELIDGVWHDRGIFDVQNWWPKLDDDTRAWLLEHTDEQVPTEILHRIIAAGGTVAGVQWEGQHEYDFRLPDEASDWIKQQR